jgi:hypothetical protein
VIHHDASGRLGFMTPRIRTLIWVMAMASCSGWGISAASQPRTTADQEALGRVLALNLVQLDLFAPAALDSVLKTERLHTVPARIAGWARRYLDAPVTEYRFGLAEGGYVDRGLIVPGLRHDCISFVYRTTELARARDAHDAVRLALSTRFAGAACAEIIDAEGRADYDHPAHLDYSLDMIRSGLWGRDVTETLAGAVLDTTGSSRYPPRSFVFLTEAALASADLREGDLVWLVLDPEHPAARALRDKHGVVIGHAGIVLIEDGTPWLAHAASRPLQPWYDRGGIVKVPLKEYLRRVERYCGLVVTRLGDSP